MNESAPSPYERPRGVRPIFYIAAVGIPIIIATITLFALIWRPTAAGVPTDETLNPIADPIQHNLAPGEEVAIEWQGEEFYWTLTPRAEYQITARVLGHKRYRIGFDAEAMPLDLALGWGELSDTAVDEWINWGQITRWYVYTWEAESPYQGSYIRSHSANVHIIPATDNLRQAVFRIREQDIVLMDGFLVDIIAETDEKQYEIATSMTRDDDGAGGCEVFYVTRLVLAGLEYR